MAFEFIIATDWHAEVFRRGSAYLVVVNIGYDQEINHTYSVMVGLDMAPAGGLELFFSITDADNLEDTDRRLFSGLDTRDLLTKEQREAVLKTALDATKSLLNQVNPERVSWFTWDAYLPHKAMVKYLRLARMVQMCGYEVHAGDVYNGRHVWWAERARGGGVGEGGHGG